MTVFCAAADWVSFKVAHEGLFGWLREVSTGLSSVAERDHPRFCGTPINCRQMIKLISLSAAFILWPSGAAFSRFLQLNSENLKDHFHWNYDGLLKLGRLCNICELQLHCGTCWPLEANVVKSVSLYCNVIEFWENTVQRHSAKEKCVQSFFVSRQTTRETTFIVVQSRAGRSKDVTRWQSIPVIKDCHSISNISSEHGPLMNRFHPRLSWAILSSCFHISPFSLISCSVLRLQVFMCRPVTPFALWVPCQRSFCYCCHAFITLASALHKPVHDRNFFFCYMHYAALF